MTSALKRRAELAVPLLLGATGIAAAVGGLGYGVTDDQGRVGTGFLPFATGAALVLLSLAELAGVVLRHSRPTAAGDRLETLAEVLTQSDQTQLAPAEPGVDALGRTHTQRVRILVVVAGLFLGAVLLVPVLGFLLSFGGLLFVVTAFVERLGLLRSALVAVATVTVLWAVFVRFLSVPLPQGLLGVI